MKENNKTIEITVTCNDKESLKEFLKTVTDAIGEKLSILKDDPDEPEPKAFQPKEGDICTCIYEDNIDAIFRYSGKTHIDEDGDAWLDGNPGLTCSGDLLKPYMIVYGEGAEHLRDNCRLATEEEIKLFNEKVKECEKLKDAGRVSEKGKTF